MVCTEHQLRGPCSSPQHTLCDRCQGDELCDGCWGNELCDGCWGNELFLERWCVINSSVVSFSLLFEFCFSLLFEICFSLLFEFCFSPRLLELLFDRFSVDVLRLVNCRVRKSSVSAVGEGVDERRAFPDSSGTVGLVEADLVFMEVVEVALVLVLLSVDWVCPVLVVLPADLVWTVFVEVVVSVDSVSAVLVVSDTVLLVGLFF